MLEQPTPPGSNPLLPEDQRKQREIVEIDTSKLHMQKHKKMRKSSAAKKVADRGMLNTVTYKKRRSNVPWIGVDLGDTLRAGRPSRSGSRTPPPSPPPTAGHSTSSGIPTLSELINLWQHDSLTSPAAAARHSDAHRLHASLPPSAMPLIVPISSSSEDDTEEEAILRKWKWLTERRARRNRKRNTQQSDKTSSDTTRASDGGSSKTSSPRGEPALRAKHSERTVEYETVIVC